MPQSRTGAGPLAAQPDRGKGWKRLGVSRAISVSPTFEENGQQSEAKRHSALSEEDLERMTKYERNAQGSRWRVGCPDYKV